MSCSLTNGVHHSKTTPVITTDIDADTDGDAADDVSEPPASHLAPQRAELVEPAESTIEMSGDYYPPPPPPLPLHDDSLSPVLESQLLTPKKDARY